MKHTRYFGALLLGVFMATASLNAAEKSKDDKIFIGGEIGLGGLGDYGVGFMAGYQHYFPKEYYIANQFRHGVRGFFNANYTSIGYSYFGRSYNYGGFFASIGADYLFDFNPQDKVVWGVFGGLGLGYVKVFSNDWFYTAPASIGFDVRLGGSVVIDNTHRFELALGSGFSTLALRYLLLF
ncbi:hypothetical protein LS71_001295 [Helicobacter jaachi]|uniref:Outer membrane beta-barrel protein n=1 Tax=Helicobacter jaachi TaxID=1677920 RepID=A0A4U8TCM0_9HELI|nr:hypothetical protein [Helicobacter jaachi]TLD97414.1 hypothetical protein LS71_001295 [Helicobacter jaachi]